VESSCEFGIEPMGSMKCWELSSGLSSSARLHRASFANSAYGNRESCDNLQEDKKARVGTCREQYEKLTSYTKNFSDS
jgi:hypothetical protein